MLVWCEVDQERLTHNICMLRAHVGSDVLIAPVVKSNGYGHGILIAAHAFLAGGAHWLCVNSLEEAQVLRAGGVICPIYLLGPVDVENVEVVISLRLRLVIYTQELIQRLIKLTSSAPCFPNKTTSSPKDTSGISVTSTIIIFMQTRPRTGARRPRIKT